MSKRNWVVASVVLWIVMLAAAVGIDGTFAQSAPPAAPAEEVAHRLYTAGVEWVPSEKVELAQEAYTDEYTTSYEQEIINHCAVKGCDPNLVIAVMYCESGGDPGAWHANPYGGSDVGLFQINDATWGDIAWADPYAQIDWATTMIANGGIGHWWPSQHCWGG